MVLRHQLNVLRRGSPKRIALSNVDRLLFVWLSRLVSLRGWHTFSGDRHEPFRLASQEHFLDEAAM